MLSKNEEFAVELDCIKFPRFLTENQDSIITMVKEYFERHTVFPENQDTSYHYICFQYDPQTVNMILERELNISPPIIPMSADTSYIWGIKYGKGKYNYPLYDIESLFHWCNIPYVTVSFGHKRISTLQYNQGLPSRLNTGHFYRADLSLPLRSTWEANIARILRYLGISFEYEKSSFPRNPISKRSKTSEADEATEYYFPDFFLSDNRIIEVKGNWDYDSRLKVQEFAAHYPQYQYYIIDTDMYSTLQQKYSSKIAFWEKPEERHSGKTVLQIVGINYGKRKETVRNLRNGQIVELIRDKDNPFDANAIKVCTIDGEEIGFISSDWACVYAQKMDMGMTFTANIHEIMQSKIDIQVKRSNPEEEILFDFLRENG